MCVRVCLSVWLGWLFGDLCLHLRVEEGEEGGHGVLWQLATHCAQHALQLYAGCAQGFR